MAIDAHKPVPIATSSLNTDIIDRRNRTFVRWCTSDQVFDKVFRRRCTSKHQASDLGIRLLYARCMPAMFAHADTTSLRHIKSRKRVQIGLSVGPTGCHNMDDWTGQWHNRLFGHNMLFQGADGCICYAVVNPQYFRFAVLACVKCMLVPKIGSRIAKCRVMFGARIWLAKHPAIRAECALGQGLYSKGFHSDDRMFEAMNKKRTDMDCLIRFLTDYSRLLVITGAGCSTASGIPDYRDNNGDWKRTQPMEFDTFMGSKAARQRYWARSFAGWMHFTQATPNLAHHKLAQLEHQGRIERLVTQNVDGLHQKAGSTKVTDLHGRLDQVRCMSCETRYDRHAFQDQLALLNPAWTADVTTVAPDGDVDLNIQDFSGFQVPDCPRCAGILKPDVVFFGESVPRSRVDTVNQALHHIDAILIVGSSLMVFSGFRFVRDGAGMGLPIAAINMGRTRADSLLTCKVEAPCGPALQTVMDIQAA